MIQFYPDGPMWEDVINQHRDLLDRHCHVHLLCVYVPPDQRTSVLEVYKYRADVALPLKPGIERIIGRGTADEPIMALSLALGRAQKEWDEKYCEETA